MVSEEGIATNPEKIREVKEWPAPTNVKEIRQFLGLTGYYRRFVPGYANLARPLIDLTRKGADFIWSETCEKAFQELKQKLISAPILAFPEDEGEMWLDTDASAHAMGAVLSQMQGGEERVLAYASKGFSSAERNYCTTRRELLALVHFTSHFRQYLLGRHFVVRTDHSSLRWLVHMKDPEGQLARWLEKLNEFDFSVEYRAGRAHGNADAMSRKPCRETCACQQQEHSAPPSAERVDTGVQCKVVTIGTAESTNTCDISVQCTPSTASPMGDCAGMVEDNLNSPPSSSEDQSDKEGFLSEEGSSLSSDNDEEEDASLRAASLFRGWTADELQDFQKKDTHISPVWKYRDASDTCPIWTEISHLSPASKSYFTQWKRLELVDGVLTRRFVSRDGKRSWRQILLPSILRKDVLRELHDSPSAGHLGSERTLARVQARFFWYDMDTDVSLWCKTCDTCASKARPLKKPKARLGTVRVGRPWKGSLQISWVPFKRLSDITHTYWWCVIISPNGQKLILCPTRKPPQ